MLNKMSLAGLVLFFSQTAVGIENFVTHATTLYPPACLSTAPLEEVNTPSGTKFTSLDQLVDLTAYPDTKIKASVEVKVLRRGCSDPDRSVMFISTSHVSGGEAFFLPRLFAEVGGKRYPLRVVNEPNSFEQEQGGTIKGPGFREFIMDGVAESKIATTENILSMEQYNGAFTLIIQDGFDSTIEFELPIKEYTGFQTPRKFPINGRLSGNWIVEGVPDQGFLISFNEFIDDDGIKNLAFLSWYTYNTDGSLLWLTAAAFHDVAVSSVDLPLDLVTNGEFLGDKTADREVAGSATLTAESCNEMTFEYDLEALGLGSDTVTLTRIFALETAGYACRDQTARLDSKN